MKRLWQIGNILALVFALTANYLVGAQMLGLPAINEIADKYETFLSPAAYAFSIWSLIYVLITVLVVYMARDIFTPRKTNTLPLTVGPYLLVANIMNGLWTYVFVSEVLWLSVIILLVLTVSLYIALAKAKIATYVAPIKTVAFVWWPLMFYAGWVTVATVVNVASWFQSLSIEVTSFASVAALIGIGGGLLSLLILRNVRELLIASSWGIFAIGIQQIAVNQVVGVAAFAVSVVLLLGVLIHGFAHRHSFAKLT